jgi:hypothetical protein
MWILLCSVLYYNLSPYVIALCTQSQLSAQSSAIQQIGEEASFSIEGLKYLHYQAALTGNVTMNNTILVLRTSRGDVLYNSLSSFSEQSTFKQSDKLLIKTGQAGTRIVRVA